MAFPPLVPTFYRCTKCHWEEEVRSDTLELNPCPKCHSPVIIIQKEKTQNLLLRLFSKK